MSAINDFNKVWVQKFPGSELPPAWEEDVKNNLAKHKKRVQELQNELKQEEVYVQFLESLLEEVEKRKKESSAGDATGKRSANVENHEKDIADVIKNTVERRSHISGEPLSTTEDGNDSKVSSSQEFKNGDLIQKDRSTNSLDSVGVADDLANMKTSDDSLSADIRGTEDDASGEDNTDDSKDHFVTVIEVNGFEKEKAAALALSKANGNSEQLKKLRKVPPRPPPKIFKRPEPSERPSGSTRPVSTPAAVGEDRKNMFEKLENSKSKGANGGDAKADRPVVFDSRSTSVANTNSNNGNNNDSNSSNSTMSSTSSSKDANPNNLSIFPRAPVSKKFEGSKMPLPPPTNNQEDKDANKNHRKSSSKLLPSQHENTPSPKTSQPSSNSNSAEKPSVRSKVFDLVSKMESSRAPAVPTKSNDPLTPKRSFRKKIQDPLYCTAHDAVISDYIDPLDVDYDGVTDQIYDCPPADSPEHVSRSLDRNKKGCSKTSTMESQASCKSGEVVDADNEPMYDTVAPDQDDDYVVLLEDGNKPTASPNNSLPKTDSSQRKRENDYANTPIANDAAATIKSQTSVISGHSITTTTSSGTTSDTDGITGSPLPQDSHSESGKTSNYVNIDYFLGKSKRKDSRASGESEDDEPVLLRAISFDQDGEGNEATDGDGIDGNVEMFEIDSGVYGSSVDSTAFGNASKNSSLGRDPHGNTPTMSAADQEKFAMFRTMVSNIAESESGYVEVLNVMLQYMKALKATLATSKPVLSTDEFNIIFYKIPELFGIHQKFLAGLQHKSSKTSVGMHFENLAKEIDVYGAFLQNYSRAVDTVRKCSQSNNEFAGITRSIRLKSLNKNQEVSLETLLYSPVSRLQKNIEIIQDLLKFLPEAHQDHKYLKSALKEFQSFLSDFKMVQPEQLYQGQDRSPRHLVKNSFIVELSEGHRKLRHLFLFNDVLVCAKYKASGRNEKFTFELKWYIPVMDCMVVEECSEPRESTPINLVALRSQASTVRDQIKRQTSRDDPKKAKADKQRKKLAELEAQLVLASPNLVFKVKSGNGRAYTFFLSSEFERSQWVDAIDTLKASQSASGVQLSMHELQSWLTSCRKDLKTNMGSYLLRTGRDENLLVGDFYVLIGQLKGMRRAADLYICVEVDSYGHFFRKAKTKMICESTTPCWNQDFVIELEGAQNLRILLYEDHPRQGTLIRAKTTIELNRSWLTATTSERKIELHDFVLTVQTRFIPSEMTIRRVPTAKPSGLFGAKITQVCKREKRQIPFILTSCVRESERRGINEVGIYRVSGSASDVSRLKKAFETNSYEAEQLLKEVDIHSVTGTLKLYLRELPEALFTDDLYPRFFEAFNLQDQELRKTTLLQLFSTLPPLNQHIVVFLLDHMVRVNSHEGHNKMSLHNLATVFGPTLLRPGARNEGASNLDLLAAGTVDVMAQAGILYFFLTRRCNNEPLQPSQMN
ncbi:unnamed protein product [Orchesella dallaii]|uniref:Active breakpoint cluster region-related protein n=1 Tax=Orchesella dallaii TaxID=48710 RepID=A0ABP1PUG0_9HEXA